MVEDMIGDVNYAAACDKKPYYKIQDKMLVKEVGDGTMSSFHGVSAYQVTSKMLMETMEGYINWLCQCCMSTEGNWVIIPPVML